MTDPGWRSSKDAALLVFAEKTFDVFLSVDRRLSIENDLSQYRLGFVIATVPNSQLESFEPIFERLRQAAENVKPGEVIYHSQGEFTQYSL